MYSAKNARNASNTAQLAHNNAVLEGFMQRVDIEIRRAASDFCPKYNCNVQLNEAENAIYAYIKGHASKHLTQCGYKFKFHPYDPGDINEPMDYGRPAYVEIDWAPRNI